MLKDDNINVYMLSSRLREGGSPQAVHLSNEIEWFTVGVEGHQMVTSVIPTLGYHNEYTNEINHLGYSPSKKEGRVNEEID